MLRHKITAAIVIAVFAFSTGCASTVRINSTPEGAQVFIDGNPIGYTPTTYTDTGVVFSTRHVEVRMDGYEVHRATLRRDSEINVLGIIGGFFCLFPWLWFLDYPSIVHYQLRPLHGDATPDAILEEGFDVALLGQ